MAYFQGYSAQLQEFEFKKKYELWGLMLHFMKISSHQCRELARIE